MTADIVIHRATTEDSHDIAIMVGELLDEIMVGTNSHAFNFNLADTTTRLTTFLEQEKYFAFIARSNALNAIGFITLDECHALYTEGTFGTIPELYVRPGYRSRGIGLRLLQHAKLFSAAREWKRLEVTTPPLPQFNSTFAFYEREGFTISGGRKMKLIL